MNEEETHFNIILLWLIIVIHSIAIFLIGVKS